MASAARRMPALRRWERPMVGTSKTTATLKALPCQAPPSGCHYATLVGPLSILPGNDRQPLPPAAPPGALHPLLRPGSAVSRVPPQAPSALSGGARSADVAPELPRVTAEPPHELGRGVGGFRPSKVSALDIYLLAVFRSLCLATPSSPQSTPRLASLSELLAQTKEKEGKQLQKTLAYEPAPPPERRLGPQRDDAGEATNAGQTGQAGAPVWAQPEALIKLAASVGLPPRASTTQPTVPREVKGDGVVLVAHIASAHSPGRPPTVVTSQGIGLLTSPSPSPSPSTSSSAPGAAQLIATCLHPLTHFRLPAPPPGGPELQSATLILTSHGHVFSACKVATALPDSDLLVLELGPWLAGPQEARGEAITTGTVPVNPYPLPVGSAIWAHTFSEGRRTGQQAGGAGEGPKGGSDRWEAAEVVEYRDEMGLRARPGTYDTLCTFSYSSPPLPGSSGGPLIDQRSGSVVGLIRGNRADYGDKEMRGIGVVAEKLWEGFRLPGLVLASEKKSRGQAMEMETERAQGRDEQRTGDENGKGEVDGR